MKKFTTMSALYVVAALMCLLGTSAHAAKFGIRVVSPDGQPIAGAAVCIGTAGDYKKFAALFTSVDGDVQVDVPPVPLVVTVSKTRFAGTRLSEPARNYSLVKIVELQDGIPGPRCKAGSTYVDASEGNDLRIRDVAVRDNAVNVQLVPELNNSANHYRLASSNKLDNLGWRKLPSAIAVDQNLLGGKVYLQVARIASVKGGRIEAHSNVMPVDLTKL